MHFTLTYRKTDARRLIRIMVRCIGVNPTQRQPMRGVAYRLTALPFSGINTLALAPTISASKPFASGSNMPKVA